jgi:hypothetical protein
MFYLDFYFASSRNLCSAGRHTTFISTHSADYEPTCRCLPKNIKFVLLLKVPGVKPKNIKFVLLLKVPGVKPNKYEHFNIMFMHENGTVVVVIV